MKKIVVNLDFSSVIQGLLSYILEYRNLHESIDLEVSI